MTTFKPGKADYVQITDHDKKMSVVKKSVLESFNASILGLGDITAQSRTVEAVAAVFDLQSFTHFCKQIEPHLSVPIFLSEFLAWMFSELRNEMTNKEYAEGSSLWGPLPFFVKFLGDGLLVLWDSSDTGNVSRRNIILACYQICQHYKQDFVPVISKKVVDAPPILRCGMARGAVYSVGDGNDYVGSCINMAARLEKIPGATFAVNKRGFNLDDPQPQDSFSNRPITKKVSVRGIGDNELIALLKDEFDAMHASDKCLLRDA